MMQFSLLFILRFPFLFRFSFFYIFLQHPSILHIILYTLSDIFCLQFHDFVIKECDYQSSIGRLVTDELISYSNTGVLLY